MQPILHRHALRVLFLARHLNLDPVVHLRWTRGALETVEEGIAVRRPDEDLAKVSLASLQCARRSRARGESFCIVRQTSHNERCVEHLDSDLLSGFHDNILRAREKVCTARLSRHHLRGKLPIRLRGILQREGRRGLLTHLCGELQRPCLPWLGHATPLRLQRQWHMAIEQALDVAHRDADVQGATRIGGHRLRLPAGSAPLAPLELPDPLVRRVESHDQRDLLLRPYEALARRHREDLGVLPWHLKAELGPEIAEVVKAQ
mmetsp:Transcript_131039/g.280256  ORF Transcript_131039/g.280256 Transcript_131039/m.280256 type:complete len:261 (+) Transcript_131039:1161-1943(+)